MSKSKALGALMGIAGGILFTVSFYAWFQTPDMPVMYAVRVFGLHWVAATAFVALGAYFGSE